MMRLFVASGIFHPDSGGPATYLYRLLPELVARGHAVRALAYGNAPTSGYPYPLTRIPFGRLSLARWAGYARAYRRGAAWADLVYINSLGLPRSGDGSKPRVMKIVGDYAWERCVNRGWIAPTEDVDTFQRRVYPPHVEWYKANRRREVRAMDRLIVPSEYLRQMVIGWGAAPEQVRVIYNALDTESHRSELTQREARERLGWAAEGRYLLTVARLTAWKGVDYLIDALVHFPEVRLAVAGDGPELAALQARAGRHGLGSRVMFLGKVPHEQVTVCLRAADYLVLYSGYEGLSHTLLQALHVGTPVIASARGGNPEVVRDGENGLLVRHPDLEALIVALRRAFEGDTWPKLAAGTQRGLERFTWSRLVEQTLTVFAEVAGSSPL